MHTGLLWFDNSKTPFSEKVNKAVDYYQKKYGLMPTLVLVNPAMISGGTEGECKVAVRPYRPVLPGHIWVGIEDKN